MSMSYWHVPENAWQKMTKFDLFYFIAKTFLCKLYLKPIETDAFPACFRTSAHFKGLNNIFWVEYISFCPILLHLTHFVVQIRQLTAQLLDCLILTDRLFWLNRDTTQTDSPILEQSIVRSCPPCPIWKFHVPFMSSYVQLAGVSAEDMPMKTQKTIHWKAKHICLAAIVL